MNEKESNESKVPENESPVAAIRDLLSEHEGQTHVIVLHDFPDPDAIASAFAHKLISANFDISSDIVHGGQISHEQNIALVRLLDIELHKFVSELPRKYDAAVFVDNQGTSATELVKALEAADVPTLLVVDHHEAQTRLEPVFRDVRPVGATATIYAEYLREELLALDASNNDHVALATALMHGLISDTGRFIAAVKSDFYAAAFLSEYVDGDLLSQIMSQARSKQVMETIHRSLDNRLLVENFSIAGIGYLRAEDRDAIPQAADFLLTEANVHTVIIYGIISVSDEEERLVGSMRTTKLTINPDDFVKEVFGKDEEGQYYGGGKVTAAGFEIPVGFLSGEQDQEYREMKWQVYDHQVKHRLFDKIGYREA